MRSWFPEVAWSSNVESLFSEMSAAVKKSGQSDLGSVANLMSVGIRGLTRRICIQEDAPQSLKLDKDDWSGQQVSGLKSKIFTPSSSPACGLGTKYDPHANRGRCGGWSCLPSLSFKFSFSGRHVSFDNIVKPFPSTSPFFHQNHCCNYMGGLLKAKSPFGKT